VFALFSRYLAGAQCSLGAIGKEDCPPPNARAGRNKHLLRGHLLSLEHDPEKWVPVFEKIVLKQKDRAG
jgi:hypothetical protein